MSVRAALTILLFLLAPSIGGAEDRDPKELMARMKSALEPIRSGTLKVDIVLQQGGGRATTWNAWRLHSRTPGGTRSLLVITRPRDVRGVAHLIHQSQDDAYTQWVYLPFTRRVRVIDLEDRFQPFLGTDFTLADIGLIRLGDRSFKLLGTEDFRGTLAYKIEETLANQWHYSRIVNWIAADTLLPLQRQYYTPAGDFWKTQTFENVTVIDGNPTPLRIRMEDRRSGSTTDFRVTELRYREDIPAELFEPGRLPRIMEHPFWALLEKSGES